MFILLYTPYILETWGGFLFPLLLAPPQNKAQLLWKLSQCIFIVLLLPFLIYWRLWYLTLPFYSKPVNTVTSTFTQMICYLLLKYLDLLASCNITTSLQPQTPTATSRDWLSTRVAPYISLSHHSAKSSRLYHNALSESIFYTMRMCTTPILKLNP